jgi:RpiB/LacA/LacB family sugar-phosphate isomerase
MMRIVIGSDHAGFELKKVLLEDLRESGHDVTDVGTYDTSPVDYPDSAAAVGTAVLEGRADRGVLICGSGVGASVAANKLRGIRAALCHDTYSAHQGVEHDDMNVLVLGARIIGTALAKELVHAYLHAEFTREDRHMRRLKKIAALEERFGKSSNKEFAK